MARSTRIRFTTVGLVLAVGVGVLVWQVVTRLGCRPPAAHQRLLAAYRADPAYRFTPPDAVRVAEESRFAACRRNLEKVPREHRPPPFTVVTRITYRIPERLLTPRQMHGMFGPQAAAAGWSLVDYSAPDEPGGRVTFCKMVLAEVSELTLSPWQDVDGSYRLNVQVFTPLDTPAGPHQKPTACPSPTSIPTDSNG